MEERIVELELRYMELKRTVEDLSSVVASQEKVIDRLTVQLTAATARLRDLGARADGPMEGDEKPPHY